MGLEVILGITHVPGNLQGRLKIPPTSQLAISPSIGERLNKGITGIAVEQK